MFNKQMNENIFLVVTSTGKGWKEEGKGTRAQKH